MRLCAVVLRRRGRPPARPLLRRLRLHLDHAELVQYGLLDGDDEDLGSPPGDLIVPFRNDVDQRRRKIQQAREIYASGAWDERIAVYLRSRGIGLTSPILKFHEQAPHRLGARLPAMLAPVVDIGGEQIGVHLTYLRRDGAGKANLPKEYQRECRGALAGGAIRLIPFDPVSNSSFAKALRPASPRPSFLACLAGLRSTREDCAASPCRPTCAASSSPRTTMCRGAGQRNALAAYDRWTAEGRSVRIKTPPDIGDDFNDVLIKRPCNARR